MNKETILRKLYKTKVVRDNFLDAPEEYRDVVSASTFTVYVDTLHQDYQMLIESVFGEHINSVMWFLYDWEPGFEINDTPIYNIDQFIDYLKNTEGFK